MTTNDVRQILKKHSALATRWVTEADPCDDEATFFADGYRSAVEAISEDLEVEQ